MPLSTQPQRRSTENGPRARRQNALTKQFGQTCAAGRSAEGSPARGFALVGRMREEGCAELEGGALCRVAQQGAWQSLSLADIELERMLISVPTWPRGPWPHKSHRRPPGDCANAREAALVNGGNGRECGRSSPSLSTRRPPGAVVPARAQILRRHNGLAIGDRRAPRLHGKTPRCSGSNVISRMRKICRRV